MILIKRNDVFQVRDTGKRTMPTPRWVLNAVISGHIELFLAQQDKFKVGDSIGDVEDYIVKQGDNIYLIPKKDFETTYKIED